MKNNTVIDLFCGAGGFSMGAERAGFEVAAAFDLDPHAFLTHKTNFPLTKTYRRNITSLTGKDLCELAGGIEKPLGIIGGPPCQGFSYMGRRRKNDARNKLFANFFRLVSESSPTFFVAENVGGILDPKYKDLLDYSFSLVKKSYHLLDPLKICASSYGAATRRSRVLFIGISKDAGFDVNQDDFTSTKIFSPSVRKAFDGMPEEILARKGETGYGKKQVEKSRNDYCLTINRKHERLGDETVLKEFEDHSIVYGILGTFHSPEVKKRYAALRPGETDSVSKSRRLDWDGLCPTLRAGTGADKGSYQAVRPIHPSNARVICPREAARLQGFPDWFRFSDTKWHSFRQIGNSISPLLSEGIMKAFAKKLNI